MSASALQLNWTGVSFASTAISGVTSVMFGQGGELIEFSGDNDRYPRIIANPISRPRASITGGDVAGLMSIAVGASGVLLATQADALGAVGGAINWSLANAVHENSEDTGQWGQFASATSTFRAFASDGVTNPLTIASRS